MEKRKDKRVKTRQFAKIGGKLAVLSDMSNGGLQISAASIPEKRNVQVSFESDGMKMNLTGIIRWIRKKNSLNNLNQFGIALKNPPQEYFQFLKKSG